MVLLKFFFFLMGLTKAPSWEYVIFFGKVLEGKFLENLQPILGVQLKDPEIFVCRAVPKAIVSGRNTSKPPVFFWQEVPGRFC